MDSNLKKARKELADAKKAIKESNDFLDSNVGFWFIVISFSFLAILFLIIFLPIWLPIAIFRYFKKEEE